jgi:hypothetical protein
MKKNKYILFAIFFWGISFLYLIILINYLPNPSEINEDLYNMSVEESIKYSPW